VIGCDWVDPDTALTLLTPAIADRMTQWLDLPTPRSTLYIEQTLVA
jgi:hypothetical protein